jgi:hypothetical protein
MIRQCAWCCRWLGETAPLDDESITHGLCKECHARLLESPVQTQPIRGTGELPKPALWSVDASE